MHFECVGRTPEGDFHGRFSGDIAKRALAQFFLTNNSLVSFGLGIAFAVLIYALCPSWPALGRLAIYLGLLGLCLVLSYKVAVIRFGVMAKSLWAARRRRHRHTAASC